MVQVYRVMDLKDSSYNHWFGDFDDVVDFLKKNKEENDGKMTKKELETFNMAFVWDLLEEIGLTMDCIYDKDCHDEG